MPHDRRPLAQIGYEAYAAATGGKTFDGRAMPEWQDLRGHTPNAWDAAARAIAEACMPAVLRPPETPGPYPSPEEQTAHEQRLRAFWDPIIKPGGVLDEEQIYRELADFSHLINEVPKVYDQLAGLSKHTYFAHVIINEADHREGQRVHEAIEEILIELAAHFQGYRTSAGEDDPEPFDDLCDFARDHGVPDLRAALRAYQAQQARFRALAAVTDPP